MGLFTLVDRISLLRDCRAIMKLMVKLQRCPKPDKAELCLEVERRLQTLSSKGAKMPDAAFTIIIPIFFHASGEGRTIFIQELTISQS